MEFIRTVLGDISAEEMGVTYSHEHIYIGDSYATQKYPEILLNDTKKISEELRLVYAAGGRTMVDTMPANGGRDVLKLAEISRNSGIHIIASTGIHLEIYYPENHWRYHCSEDELIELFVADIETGIDAMDYGGPYVFRTKHKAGMIKLATGNDIFSAHQEKIFRAVSETHKLTGAPILTHTNSGLRAVEQAVLFEKLGVDLNHVILSHVDKYKDIGYQRAILDIGVNVEYDSAMRWREGEKNWTYYFLEELLPEYPNQICVGMDAAKSKYWRTYGGKPGIDFLMREFRTEMNKRGLGNFLDHLMVKNPVAIFSFRMDLIR